MFFFFVEYASDPFKWHECSRELFYEFFVRWRDPFSIPLIVTHLLIVFVYILQVKFLSLTKKQIPLGMKQLHQCSLFMAK